MTTVAIPREFIWRRVHSLMGLWLVIFLIEHLLTNSQAALLLGDNGRGFVQMVNAIHNLPYLEVVEVLLLGVPLAIHAVWGIQYLRTAKANSCKSDGSKPSLKEYRRNRAYSWQRITSWILLIGIIGHVAKFRFIDYPISVHQGTESIYCVRLSVDDGLYTVAARLGVQLYGKEDIDKIRQDITSRADEHALVELSSNLRQEEKFDPYLGVQQEEFDPQKEVIFTAAQKYLQSRAWLHAIEKRPITEQQVIAATSNFGTASLLSVRDTFKSPVYVVLYTVFVLAACFHAFNGFWTFLVTWGFVIKRASQKSMASVAVALMLALMFLGLAAVWGTYWLNLKM